MPGKYEFNLELVNDLGNNAHKFTAVKFVCNQVAEPSFPITLPTLPEETNMKQSVIIKNAPRIIKIIVKPLDAIKVKHPRRVAHPVACENNTFLSFKFFGKWIVFIRAKKKIKSTELPQTPVTVTDKQH